MKNRLSYDRHAQKWINHLIEDYKTRFLAGEEPDLQVYLEGFNTIVRGRGLGQ